jgi:hypothetical protein
VTQFVHFTDSKKVDRVVRRGILAVKTRLEGVRGCYCTPVLQDYFRTHQWLRELKRRGCQSMHAVQFNQPPETRVLVGRFGQEHLDVTAAEAAAVFAQHKDGLGLEVVVPHSVPRSAIGRVYLPSQVLGWRYFPEAKGRKPCGCDYCNFGQIKGSRRLTELRLPWTKPKEEEEEVS